MGREFDVIIYGASGYTGMWVVEEATNLLKPGSDFKKFTWAVAGRSEKKLTETLQQVSKLTGVDVTKTTKIVADTSDLESLKVMARQCTVLVNVVGPYKLYGENVIKACLAEGTHHVDLAGELQWLDRIQLEYHDQAKDKGVYILQSCGYDSIPADCGVTYLQQKFRGDINSIESFVTLNVKSKLKGTKVNTGTWNSAINFLGDMKEWKALQPKLYPQQIPKSKYPLNKRIMPHYNSEVGGWCMPFLGVDNMIVKRSQYYLYTEEKKRAIQFNAYSQYPFFLMCFATMLIAGIAYFFSRFKAGVRWMEQYPQIFSLGLVKKGGPTREQADNAVFNFHLVASGWDEKLAEPTDQHTQPPNKKMSLNVSGINPGYRATAAMMLQAGLTTILEKDKLPSKGGVYTPGAAFAKTSIIPRIHSRGVSFKLDEED